MFLSRIVCLFIALFCFNSQAEYLTKGSAKTIVYDPLPSNESRGAREDEIKLQFLVDGISNEENFRVTYNNYGLIEWEGKTSSNQSALLQPILKNNQYVLKKNTYPEAVNIPIHETVIAIFHLKRMNQEIFATELKKVEALREKNPCLKLENIGIMSPNSILNCWSAMTQEDLVILISQANEIAAALSEIFPAQQQYMRLRLDLNALSTQFCNQLNFDETEQKLISNHNQLILDQMYSLSACADGLGANNPKEFTYKDFRKKIYDHIPKKGSSRRTLLKYWYSTFIKEVPRNFIQTSYICKNLKEDWNIFLTELRKDKYNFDISQKSCNTEQLAKVERIFQ